MKEIDLNSPQYRFAAYALLFNTGNWILRMIENCAPHVEKIYIAYSPYPWTYNPSARKNFMNRTSPEILKQSPHYHKIHLIEGVWAKDEDQRNSCLEQAKKDGIDFMFIQDADEFYTHADYKKMIDFISQNPENDYYKARWYTFWKSFDYVLADADGKIDSSLPEVAINCRKPIRFKHMRIPEGDRFKFMDVVCYHGSYVLTDEEVYEKISTWSHSLHFDRTLWFILKWLAWMPSLKNLHPAIPKAWKQAVKYDGSLPEVIQDLRGPSIKLHTNPTQVLVRYFSIVLAARFKKKKKF